MQIRLNYACGKFLTFLSHISLYLPFPIPLHFQWLLLLDLSLPLLFAQNLTFSLISSRPLALSFGSSSSTSPSLMQASKRGLKYPRYAWITNGDYIDGWWRETVSDASTCSDEVVANVLDRALAIQLHPVAPLNSITNVGLVSCMYASAFKRS